MLLHWRVKTTGPHPTPPPPPPPRTNTPQIIAAALGRGPLVAEDWPYGTFALIYALPIYPSERACVGRAGRRSDSVGTWRDVLKLAANVAGERACRPRELSVCVSVCGCRGDGADPPGAGLAGVAQLSVPAAHPSANVDAPPPLPTPTAQTPPLVWLLAQPLPKPVHHWLVAYSLYLYISLVMCGPILLLQLGGVDLVPPFDKPWMATSLSDFWGRRWVSWWSRWRLAVCMVGARPAIPLLQKHAVHLATKR